MDIRQITDSYSVAPMLDPSDFAAIKEAGFATIICNRPDVEVPPSHQAEAMEAAALAAGLAFVVNPVTHQGLTEEIVSTQRAAIDGSTGPTLAYCASGTRSTIVWGLGFAPEFGADGVVRHAAQAGYDVGHLTPLFERMAGSGD